MRRAHTIAAAALAALLFGTAGNADAQADDPTGGYDIDDVMHRQPHSVSELPTIEAARGRPITFNLSGAGRYTSNAGATRTNDIDTGYVTPGFGIDVTPVSLGGWAIGGGALLDADYYAGDYNDDFGEGRIEGFAFASHRLGPGTFTAEYIALAIFDNEFNDQDFRLNIADLTYSISSGNIFGEISAEYHDSSLSALRRTRLTGLVGYAFPDPQFGYDLSVEADLAFSDFNSGSNSGRNDTVAAIVFIAESDLGAGWSVEWDAAIVNRFSNRELSRFTAVEAGVEVTKVF